MKKTYVQPEVKAYKMVISQMMMASPTSASIRYEPYSEGDMEDL